MKEQKLDPSKVEGLGVLIDCTDNEFKSHCSDKNVGYCLNLSVLLKLTYEQLLNIKNDLLKLDSKEGDEVDTTLKSVYVQMGKVEHKVLLLNQVIKDKSVT